MRNLGMLPYCIKMKCSGSNMRSSFGWLLVTKTRSIFPLWLPLVGKKNRILRLKDTNGVWRSQDNGLNEVILEYFQSSYLSDGYYVDSCLEELHR